MDNQKEEAGINKITGKVGPTLTGLRYCINSAAMELKTEEKSSTP
jgi:peptide methionine sulfoxide reductase MsrB